MSVFDTLIDRWLLVLITLVLLAVVGSFVFIMAHGAVQHSKKQQHINKMKQLRESRQKDKVKDKKPSLTPMQIANGVNNSPTASATGSGANSSHVEPERKDLSGIAELTNLSNNGIIGYTEQNKMMIPPALTRSLNYDMIDDQTTRSLGDSLRL